MLISPEKRIYTLQIDKGFQGLIRPLYKNEYLLLEANLIKDGCREPISVWNGIIVDGHNRYKICTKHQIPFAIEEKYFSCREEAIAWICANQLGRRNLTEESRKYLIGKQYESEKIVCRKKAVYQSHDESDDLPYETYNPSQEIRVVETKRKTAQRIGEDNHISHGTVEKYSIYSRAIEEIGRKEPQMAAKILSGRYKVSHNGVLALAQRSPEEIRELNKRLEHTQQPFAKYQTTRKEIQGLQQMSKREPGKQVSVKDMPEYDPDAEVVGLTLTVPSWSSSIDRIVHSDLNNVSESARVKIRQALLELMDTINALITALKEAKDG